LLTGLSGSFSQGHKITFQNDFTLAKNSLHYKNVSHFAADFKLYFSLFSLTMINFQEEDTNHVHELINTPISFEERWLETQTHTL